VISRPVGATCTIVAQLMRERELRRPRGGLAADGIYEDTGACPTGTTPTDLRSWLAARAGRLAGVGAALGDEGLQPDSSSCSTGSSRAARRSWSATPPVELSMVEVDR